MEDKPVRIKSRGRSYCSVLGCFNSSETRPEISFFRHPANVERRMKWLELIGREELKEKPTSNYNVCEDHFNKQDILPGIKRKTLKKNALPALRLPIQPALNFKQTNLGMGTSIKIEKCEDPPISLDDSSPKTLPDLRLPIQPALNSTETTMVMETNIKLEQCEDSLRSLDDSSRKALPVLQLSNQPVLNAKETDMVMETNIKLEEGEDPPRSLDDSSPKALPALQLPIQPVMNAKETTMVMETNIKVGECDDPLRLLDDSTPKATRKRKLASPPPGCSKKILETQSSKLVYLGQDTFQRLCNTFLPNELADIVKAEMFIKDFEGKKNLDFKLMSLYLYHSSPQSYRMLKDALQLPNITSLHKTAVPITTEINANFMLLLENKVKTMTDVEKNCSVLIGSMSLKPSFYYNITQDNIIGFHDINGKRLPVPAEIAYIVMVRGIYGNWKQPVGYALLCKGDYSVEFNEWIDGLLEQLFNLGLNVRTFVSDTGNEFINAAKNRSVTIEQPYFFINDRKVYYIFDAPHLFKLLRNHFIEHDFLFQDRIAKYEHVRCFYHKEKKKEFKLAPKLTLNHICPTNFEKKELRYAVQLLSNSVATGISTYVDFFVIDQSGRDTADFIRLMNNLFDCLNSFDFKDTSQTELLNEMLIFFSNLKFNNLSFEPKFIEGFQITITSILQLFNDIKTDGYTYLPTRRLNMEVIDNFFDQVKTKCGIATTPKSWHLLTTYRKCFLNSFMKPREKKYCADGLAEWLTQIQANKFTRSTQNVTFDTDDEFDDIKIKTSDYKKQEFNSSHRVFEVCHYLLTKCAAEAHDCKWFKSYIKPYKNIPDFIDSNRYSCYRTYSQNQGKSLLVVPCDSFVAFVKKMDAQFVLLFKKTCTRNRIAELLFKKLIDITYHNRPCACFPKVYLVKLFVRVVMYNALKYNNHLFTLNRRNVGRITVNRL